MSPKVLQKIGFDAWVSSHASIEEFTAWFLFSKFCPNCFGRSSNYRTRKFDRWGDEYYY